MTGYNSKSDLRDMARAVLTDPDQTLMDPFIAAALAALLNPHADQVEASKAVAVAIIHVANEATFPDPT